MENAPRARWTQSPMQRWFASFRSWCPWDENVCFPNSSWMQTVLWNLDRALKGPRFCRTHKPTNSWHPPFVRLPVDQDSYRQL